MIFPFCRSGSSPTGLLQLSMYARETRGRCPRSSMMVPTWQKPFGELQQRVLRTALVSLALCSGLLPLADRQAVGREFFREYGVLRNF